MIAQRIINDNGVVTSDEATVQTVMALLAEHKNKKTAIHRWVCEVCGMVHTDTEPTACDSCGATDVVQQPDFRSQMNSRW